MIQFMYYDYYLYLNSLYFFPDGNENLMMGVGPGGEGPGGPAGGPPPGPQGMI